MFGNTPQKKQFSYTSAKSVRIEHNKPIRERIKITSFSSQEKKSDKKRMVFYIILLIVIVLLMYFFGFSPSKRYNLIIEEKEIEKVDG